MRGVLKFRKDDRGNAFVESLWVLPVLLMMFLFIFEAAFVMYDMAVINYHTSTAATNAAIEGCFTEDIRVKLEDNLQKWTTHGKSGNFTFDHDEDSPYDAEGVVVIYGSDMATQVERGDDIEVGVRYPLKFKSFVIEESFHWVVKDRDVSLKAWAVTSSEKYIAP